jgi:hypothetical protein
MPVVPAYHYQSQQMYVPLPVDYGPLEGADLLRHSSHPVPPPMFSFGSSGAFGGRGRGGRGGRGVIAPYR